MDITVNTCFFGSRTVYARRRSCNLITVAPNLIDIDPPSSDHSPPLSRRRHYLLVCFCGIFVSMHIYLNTFTYASPSHRCLLHAIPNDAYDINATSAKGQWIDKLIPKTDTGALGNYLSHR